MQHGLMIAGSLRKDSFNLQLAEELRKNLPDWLSRPLILNDWERESMRMPKSF